ncbi:hypothetical protein FB451DRAFT_1189093 [Mycena latifolia]|nr:hypothetical protein FB451DRAFT_1189093 [Mycena latifolia]
MTFSGPSPSFLLHPCAQFPGQPTHNSVYGRTARYCDSVTVFDYPGISMESLQSESWKHLIFFMATTSTRAAHCPVNGDGRQSQDLQRVRAVIKTAVISPWRPADGTVWKLPNSIWDYTSKFLNIPPPTQLFSILSDIARARAERQSAPYYITYHISVPPHSPAFLWTITPYALPRSNPDIAVDLDAALARTAPGIEYDLDWAPNVGAE